METYDTFPELNKASNALTLTIIGNYWQYPRGT